MPGGREVCNGCIPNLRWMAQDIGTEERGVLLQPAAAAGDHRGDPGAGRGAGAA